MKKPLIFQRILQLSSKKSIFLFGPRGTGKSFWLRQTFERSIYIDLLDSEAYFRLLSTPEKLESYIPPAYDQYVIIDEIQKIPQLLNEVHRLIETQGYRFILTGSNARKLRTGGINLLAGRAHTHYMYPLTCEELGSHFSLKSSLKYGHLPSVYQEENPHSYLSSYVNTYLQEEVLQEGLTRNLGAFTRFLETASFSQGAVLNLSEIGRESGLNSKLVESYFKVLEDLLLAIRIPVFTRKAKRRMVRHPKFYYFDVGIYQTIRPKGVLDSISEIEGVSFETLFLQELRAVNDYYQLGFQIYYWRTSNQVEVDFILYGKLGLFAFEIKRKSNYTPKDLKGLRAFLKDFPMASAFLVYGGNTEYYENSITVIPYQKAIIQLRNILNKRH